MVIDPLYSLSGLFVGLLVGQTGVGGGSLMTPLLILIFGIHPATAVGTDLLFAGFCQRSGRAVGGFRKLPLRSTFRGGRARCVARDANRQRSASGLSGRRRDIADSDVCTVRSSSTSGAQVS